MHSVNQAVYVVRFYLILLPSTGLQKDLERFVLAILMSDHRGKGEKCYSWY